MPRGVYERKKAKAKARRTKARSSSSVGAESGAEAWQKTAVDVAGTDAAKDAKIYEQSREIVHLNARLSERDGRLAAQRDNLLYTLELLAEGSLRLVRAVRQQE